MKIEFVLYDQFTALDLVGPYEVIARWPGAEVHFVATGPDPIRADAGLAVLPTRTPDSLTAPDMALALTGRVHGPATAEAIQLVIEYDPQPPFDDGSPHQASDQVKRAAGKILMAAASP
jgi:putative intracellular protease/amidase